MSLLKHYNTAVYCTEIFSSVERAIQQGYTIVMRVAIVLMKTNKRLTIV